MIEISNVSKWFGNFQVLRNCTTSIAQGEVVVVCGPSGSGKSTLIKCINALEEFQEGTITVAGVSVGSPQTDRPKLRSRVGMVFQNFELFAHCRSSTISRWRSKRCSAAAGTRRPRRAALSLPASASPAAKTNIRSSFQVDSSSGSPSPGRSRWIRSRCCSTSRPRRSIPRWSPKCLM
jgi:glutamate/aspartate transport system ATP-binding protein